MPEHDLRFAPSDTVAPPAPPLIVTLPDLAIGGQVLVRHWPDGTFQADWRGFEGDAWRPLGALAELGGSVEVAP